MSFAYKVVDDSVFGTFSLVTLNTNTSETHKVVFTFWLG